MAATRTYDLMLVTSAAVDDERRAKIHADAEAAIAAGGGEVVATRDWGERPLTFDIDHQGRGSYRLVEFSGPADLVAPLTRQLRITDGVLRARVTHTVPGVDLPEGPKSAAPPASSAPEHEPATPPPAAGVPAPADVPAPAGDPAPADEAPAGEPREHEPAT